MTADEARTILDYLWQQPVQCFRQCTRGDCRTKGSCRGSAGVMWIRAYQHLEHGRELYHQTDQQILDSLKSTYEESIADNSDDVPAPSK